MKRKVPLCFLRVITYWYSNLLSVVKWNDTLSRSFFGTSGVRQGGILSPRLFTVYVDDLLIALRKSGVGCHIVDSFVAAIMYADDLALMAPSRSSLQTLLYICESYGNEWCITYNPTKTVVMLLGNLMSLCLFISNVLPISFESGCKYLGM